jgi:hypothetical protein
MTRASEERYLDSLRKHAADTLRYLSSAIKPERERAVCRAFLRSIGVRFVEGEIKAPCREPIDVSFRDARFQVRELMEVGRRRGDEWKQRQTRWNNARSMAGLLAPVMYPTPMTRSELVEAVSDALEAKSGRYGVSSCYKLDALVYVNLTDTRVLKRRSAAQDLDRLNAQGWRSVSIVFPPYGIVLVARRTAPQFLLEVAGKVRKSWRKADGLFET